MRIQSFEFMDLPQTPKFLRDSVVESLGNAMRWSGVCKTAAPVFKEFQEGLETNRILDMCSGSGEPATVMLDALKEHSDNLPHFYISDLFPVVHRMSEAAAKFPDHIEPINTPLDASNVPDLYPHSGPRMREGGNQHLRDWRVLVEELARIVEGASLDCLQVASVAGREADALLAQELSAALGMTPDFYYSPAADAGLTNCYAEPERLGVDRWLAMVDAWHRAGGAAIVVDCGSALTIDLVDRAGQHRGGYIVPGLRMLESSLLSRTASVRFQEAQSWSSLDPGNSTVACVHNGTMRMTVAFITETVVALQNLVQDTCPVFVTGGDAMDVMAWLPDGFCHLPDMVLDGLERVTAGQ